MGSGGACTAASIVGASAIAVGSGSTSTLFVNDELSLLDGDDGT